MIFLGDIALYKLALEDFIFDPKFMNIVKDKYVIANLECPITESNQQKDFQAINLSAPSNSLDVLDFCDLFSLANNHILDYNTVGLEDTIQTLNQLKIPYFGIVDNNKDEISPCCFIHNAIKFAIFGATRYANATKTEKGTVSDSSHKLYKSIKDYKLKGYFVIVYYHWGYEYVRIPSPRERRLAHKAINCGADLIIGSHPHIYQGIETFKGKTIVYSLGNFIFHSSVFDKLAHSFDNKALTHSYFIELKIEKNLSYKIKLHPYLTNDYGLELLNEYDKNEMLNDVQYISRNLITPITWKYVREYYSQANAISQQNIKVRNNFQTDKNTSFFNKLLLYKNANFQDLKNRIAGLLIKIFHERKD